LARETKSIDNRKNSATGETAVYRNASYLVGCGLSPKRNTSKTAAPFHNIDYANQASVVTRSFTDSCPSRPQICVLAGALRVFSANFGARISAIRYFSKLLRVPAFLRRSPAPGNAWTPAEGAPHKLAPKTLHFKRARKDLRWIK
jgi:hypothetical protein